MTEDNPCVHLRVKLVLKNGQTRGSIQDIIANCDYSFLHEDIIRHEIVDIIQTPFYRSNRIDPFDMIKEDS